MISHIDGSELNNPGNLIRNNIYIEDEPSIKLIPN